MADSTRLTGGERGAEAEERKPGPRLRGKMLEGVPERAGRRGIEEVRALARGMPTEFITADGERVTLVMGGKPDMESDPRDVGLGRELLLLDIAFDLMVRLEPFASNKIAMPIMRIETNYPSIEILTDRLPTQGWRLEKD